MKLATGFYHRAKNNKAIAIRRVFKKLSYQYRDRRNKKRQYKKQWIMKINAATREHGIPYNTFAAVLTRSNIELDRKILSDLAANEPYTFRAISQVLVQEPTFEQLY